MEIEVTHKDIISVLPETEGRVRISVNDISIILPPMTAAIVSVTIQQIIKNTFKRKRKTLKPK